MKLPTGRQMSNIDLTTISEYQMPSILLMENAGRNIADNIIFDYPEIIKSKPVILVGPGNNGGDALVISRQFRLKNIDSICVFLVTPDRLRGDAGINYTIHKNLMISSRNCLVNNFDDWNRIKNELFFSPYFIDGIFGTGFEGKVTGLFESVIESINTGYYGTVLSIDVPSGLICEDTTQNSTIIKANKTYSVGLPKLGMVDYPGKEFCNEISIVSIGFPEQLLNSDEIKTGVITFNDALKMMPERKENTHKGNFGHVLVIAGSEKYHGAAHLTSKAAFSSGAGLVTLASVYPVCQTLKSKDDAIITIPLNSNEKSENTEKDYLKIILENFSIMEKEIGKYNSCVIGPGLGQSDKTFEFIKLIIKEYSGKLVLDADALNMISKDLSILKNTKAKIVITPHIFEFSRLSGKSVDEIKNSKVKISTDFAKENNVVLILKDSVTLITDGENTFYNSTGNSGLARGGSGDVLAGMVSGFLARDMDVLKAPLFAVFLHGYIADLLASEIGKEGISPSLLIENIYRGFISLSNSILREKPGKNKKHRFFIHPAENILTNYVKIENDLYEDIS